VLFDRRGGDLADRALVVLAGLFVADADLLADFSPAEALRPEVQDLCAALSGGDLNLVVRDLALSVPDASTYPSSHTSTVHSVNRHATCYSDPTEPSEEWHRRPVES
jgi:hypothetical protein